MRIRVNLFVNRMIQVLLLFLFLLVVAESLYAPIFAVFVTNFVDGATLVTAGFAVALFSIVKSIVQLPLARRLDKKVGERDDFWTLVVGSLLSTLIPFFLLFVSEPWHLYLIEMVAGVGAACMMAAYYAIFARHVDKGSEGFEWSLFSVGGLTVSYAIGAAVGGLLADRYGFHTLFLISGGVNMATMILLLSIYPYIDGLRKKVFPPIVPFKK